MNEMLSVLPKIGPFVVLAMFFRLLPVTFLPRAEQWSYEAALCRDNEQEERAGRPIEKGTRW